ncbi:MAG: hypothetical protein R3A12_18135 [Ignavibacteria bacterium]
MCRNSGFCRRVTGAGHGCHWSRLQRKRRCCFDLCKRFYGPYDFNVTNRLRELAKKNKINYVTDIYPYYGSDGSAALSAGYDVRVGLIGPGVSASHGVERTHGKALIETYDLTKAYIDWFESRSNKFKNSLKYNFLIKPEIIF